MPPIRNKNQSISREKERRVLLAISNFTQCILFNMFRPNLYQVKLRSNDVPKVSFDRNLTTLK